MVTTIEEAIHPLILTSSLLGLGIYSSKKPYLSVFYNLTLWITYGCLFYYIVTVLKVEIWFQSAYAIIDLQFGILTSITSVIINMYLNKVYIDEYTIFILIYIHINTIFILIQYSD